ncbi:YcgL domain-containing protein [Cellvibrio sp.]|uniref:YcgL domain-containing protein n=1 Tax=Cellvibrio sp. TaxID=1965322 RepID=UPI003964880C
MKIICQIYRSPKEEGMYLYVKKEEGLSKVPDELIKLFGTPQPAMVILLTPDKKLARVSVEKVAESLDTQGYYLQMPPRNEQDPEMQLMRAKNSKLSGH